MSSSLEREIKLRYDSATMARDAVLNAGATPLRGRRLQEDALLDTADQRLRETRCVLRVRTECGKSLVTFKGPPQDSVMKVREELETVVGDGDALLQILAALGYTPWFRYQKYREEFAARDLVVAVDETPIGTFIELEGGEDSIVEMSRALGRESDDYIVESYRAIFATYRASLGLADGDMLFDAGV